MKTEIREIARRCGACAVGFAAVGKVGEEQLRRFDRWLTLGLNGELAYMANHRALREDPATLLPGARTLISLAFPYPGTTFNIQHSTFTISSYALGEDYHIALRKRLEPLVGHLTARGEEVRVCIDSAPLHERYWAVRAGLGFVGKNGSLIIPGIGSRVFLAEILWTADCEDMPGHNGAAVLPTAETETACLLCRRCVDACPTGAITTDGIDARRCLSALTIEHRGPFTEQQTDLLRSAASRGAAPLFGCDICRNVCPHNHKSAPLPEFLPGEAIKTLSIEELQTMTGGEFKRRFAASPLLRAGLPLLRRTLRTIPLPASHPDCGPNEMRTSPSAQK